MEFLPWMIILIIINSIGNTFSINGGKTENKHSVIYAFIGSIVSGAALFGAYFLGTTQ